MAVFKMLFLFVSVALCGSLSESLWMSEGLYEEVVPRKLQIIIDQGEKLLKMEEEFRSQMLALAVNVSQKLDNFIREVSDIDALQSCELPMDKNVISTVIGSRIYKKPRFIRKGYSAFYRCKDPGSYELVGGPPNEKCLGADYSQTVVDRKCVRLKNETYWQSASLKLEWCTKAGNMTGVSVSNPVSRTSYLSCENNDGFGWKAVSKHNCPHRTVFDEESQKCLDYAGNLHLESSLDGLKPSIIANATNSTWDIMGWLLVGKGSNVTLECLYPSFQGVTDVVWKKTELFAHGSVKISGLRISDYSNREVFYRGKLKHDRRNRIELNDIGLKETGIYVCEDSLDRKSHAIIIAIKGEECALVPLPDFDLHQEYYRKYPVMNRVRRRCLETGNEKKRDFFTDGVKAVKIYV